MATKTVSTETIKLCLKNGYTLIGENRAQELRSKLADLENLPHETHFIGHVQSNKVKQIIEHVNCIHSVDRISLVNELAKQLDKKEKIMNILVQVNTSAEASKFGLAPNELSNFLKDLSHYERIKVKGLMTIGLFNSDKEQVKPCFSILKKLAQEIDCTNFSNIDLTELSMGMSGDYEIAIEEGATIIRLGTAIFGSRSFPDSYYWNEQK